MDEQNATFMAKPTANSGAPGGKQGTSLNVRFYSFV